MFDSFVRGHDAGGCRGRSVQGAGDLDGASYRCVGRRLAAPAWACACGAPTITSASCSTSPATARSTETFSARPTATSRADRLGTLSRGLATHRATPLLVEPVEEAVLAREHAARERAGAHAGLRALADVPVLLGDRVPELDRGLGLEQLGVGDRLRPEHELAHDRRVVRALRVADVVHRAVGVQVQHQVRELVRAVVHLVVLGLEVRELRQLALRPSA